MCVLALRPIGLETAAFGGADTASVECVKPERAHDELRTARLALRHPVVSDLEVVLRIHQIPEAVAHNPSDAIQDQAGAQLLLQRWIDHWHRHAVGYWAVSRRGDPSVFGFCGIKVMKLHDRPVANLFYRFDPCVWGCGVASEAASVVVEWALARSPALPVIARVRPDNVASARVAIKAGLSRVEGLDTLGEDGLDQIFVSPGWQQI